MMMMNSLSKYSQNHKSHTDISSAGEKDDDDDDVCVCGYTAYLLLLFLKSTYNSTWLIRL
jgi:hypothetical protein